MPDTNFESTFSEIAHSALLDKAPGLMDHLIGFQLIDSSEDQTHAIGIFGFKVNEQWFYAPVFFMGGVLKGTELLYVKGQDIFVPLQDNWVNYLLSKQPRELGNTEPHQEGELKIQAPNFNSFGQNPNVGGGSKWACAAVPEADRTAFYAEAAGLARGLSLRAPEALQKSALATFLLECSSACIPLAEALQRHEKLAEAMISMHGSIDAVFPPPEKIAAAMLSQQLKQTSPSNSLKPVNLPKPAQQSTVKTEYFSPQTNTASLPEQQGGQGTPPTSATDASQPIQKAAAALEDKRVTVFTSDDIPDLIAGPENTLSEADKERLAKGEIVVKDHRTNTSKLYDADFQRTITNPTSSGKYDVLLASGEFEEFYVSIDPKTIGEGRAAGIALLFNKGNIQIVPTKAIFVKKQDNPAKLDSLYKEAKSLTAMRPGYMYVGILPNGQTTVPFRAMVSSKNKEGLDQFTVLPRQSYYKFEYNKKYRSASLELGDANKGSGCCKPVCCTSDDKPDTRKDPPYRDYNLREGRNLIASPKIARALGLGSSTLVPEATRAYEIGWHSDTEKDVRLGTLELAEKHILKYAEVIEVFQEGPEVIIRREQSQKRMRKQAAFRYCINDLNLDEADTRTVLDSLKPRQVHQYFVEKRAFGNGPSAPPIPPYAENYSSSRGVRQVEDQADFVNVDGMGEMPGSRQSYALLPGDPDVQSAIQAGQSGDKDVFDTAVIGGLVKAVDVNSITDGFLPDIIKGMDKVGRILFLFYWHNDTFRERYGRQDMVDMEDSLKNVFKSIGDLAIFLKQKTIDSNPASSALDVGLDRIA